MWDFLADVVAGLFSPPAGKRRWVRLLYVVLAVLAVIAATVLVVRTWPSP